MKARSPVRRVRKSVDRNLSQTAFDAIIFAFGRFNRAFCKAVKRGRKVDRQLFEEVSRY